MSSEQFDQIGGPGDKFFTTGERSIAVHEDGQENDKVQKLLRGAAKSTQGIMMRADPDTGQITRLDGEPEAVVKAHNYMVEWILYLAAEKAKPLWRKKLDNFIWKTFFKKG